MLVKRDDILQINLVYFSPHHKNKFVNSVNSLHIVWPHWQKQKRQTCSTFFDLVCIRLANQNTVFCGQIIAVCSLITQ